MTQRAVILILLVWMATGVLAQSSPELQFIPTADEQVLIPILEVADPQEAQRLWNRATGLNDVIPLNMFAIYGVQTFSFNQLIPVTDAICGDFLVWTYVNDTLVPRPFSNCDASTLLTTYRTGFYWITPQFDVELPDPSNLIFPLDVIEILGTNDDETYSLLVTLRNGSEVIDIWDHENESYINMPNDLGPIDLSAFAWRKNASEITILGQYQFDNSYVLLNYDPQNGTFYTIIESSNPVLACSQIRWLTDDALAISVNCYFGDALQARIINFTTGQVIFENSLPEQIREMFIIDQTEE